MNAKRWIRAEGYSLFKAPWVAESQHHIVGHRKTNIEGVDWWLEDSDSKSFFLSELTGYETPPGFCLVDYEEFQPIQQRYAKISKEEHWLECAGCGTSVLPDSQVSNLDGISLMCSDCKNNEPEIEFGFNDTLFIETVKGMSEVAILELLVKSNADLSGMLPMLFETELLTLLRDQAIAGIPDEVTSEEEARRLVSKYVQAMLHGLRFGWLLRGEQG